MEHQGSPCGISQGRDALIWGLCHSSPSSQLARVCPAEPNDSYSSTKPVGANPLDLIIFLYYIRPSVLCTLCLHLLGNARSIYKDRPLRSSPKTLFTFEDSPSSGSTLGGLIHEAC